MLLNEIKHTAEHATGVELKNKFQQICRTLCIPMRELSKRRKVYQESKKVKKVEVVAEPEFA